MPVLYASNSMSKLAVFDQFVDQPEAGASIRHLKLCTCMPPDLADSTNRGSDDGPPISTLLLAVAPGFQLEQFCQYFNQGLIYK